MQGCKSSSFKGTIVPVTSYSFSKVIRSSYKERDVPKILIVTSSYNAKKGTHATSYTLLLHEKIVTFIGVGSGGQGGVAPLNFHT